jgi:hypothetical protein
MRVSVSRGMLPKGPQRAVYASLVTMFVYRDYRSS